jgi:DNA excision repair protein ERCC-5
LGSDYTNGVKGIGIVYAVEILNEFGDLETFRKWITDAKVPSDDAPTSSLQKKLVRVVAFITTKNLREL